MKSLILLILLLGVMAFTNPRIGVHKETLKEEVINVINEENNLLTAAAEGDAGGIGMALGMSIIQPIVELAVDQMVTVDDYYIFSITNITIDEETKPIGFGAFGRVFVPDSVKDKLRDGMKQMKAEANL